MRDDEDRLIERIRARAWDPARRCGKVGVPFSAVVACTADPDTAQLRANLARSAGMMPLDRWTSVNGGGLTAIEYYRDATHEPFRPPLSPSEMDGVELRLGVGFPPLLRRVYTEVGDGGFGPSYGLPSFVHLEEDEVAMPVTDLGLPLCDYGCANWDWVSLEGPDFAVCNDDEIEPGQAIPLAEWFERWLR